MNWAIELAEKYRPKHGQANLFGVIIYTDSHAYVRRILEDEAYWRALDEISGPQWTVFAACACHGGYVMPKQPQRNFEMMIRVWKEPKENRSLLDAFEIDSTENLPVLVVFAEAVDGTVHKKVMKIDDTFEDSTYKSIKRILEQVAAGLVAIDEEYLRKDTRAFDTVVNYRLRNFEEWDAVKKGIRFIKWLRSLR